MINEEKLINLLFEGNESLVVKNGERFHLEDYIEYFNKPGLIVATIKGDSELGVQQLPIGAVDSFRFMQITNEDAIINQAKNNGKSYDQILKEYENEKCGILNQWKKMNSDKLNGLMNKYGNRFLGMDIVENKKKIEPKDEKEIKTDDKKEIKSEPTPEQPSETSEITEDELMEDTMIGAENSPKGFINKIKYLFSDERSGIKEIVKNAHNKGKDGVQKFSEELINNIENDELKIKIKTNDGKIHGFNSNQIQIVNNDILMMGYYPDNEDTKFGFTVSSFMEKFKEIGKGKSLTKTIKGIVCLEFTRFGDSLNKKEGKDIIKKTDDERVESDLPDALIITGIDNSKVKNGELLLYSDIDSVNAQKTKLKNDIERKKKIKERIKLAS